MKEIPVVFWYQIIHRRRESGIVPGVDWPIYVMMPSLDCWFTRGSLIHLHWSVIQTYIGKFYIIKFLVSTMAATALHMEKKTTRTVPNGEH